MWGATIDAISDAEHKLISIRAPLCGVRLSLLFLFVNIFYFNPRTPMWGATCRSLYSLRVMPTFQSAHPYVGCDSEMQVPTAYQAGFQSAHPYVGCDPTKRDAQSYGDISIRAPLCGVRRQI